MADNLKSLLEGMGSTADEVAAFLEGQGVKGWRRDGNGCPVARYLTAINQCRYYVGTGAVSTEAGGFPYEWIVELPNPVRGFVSNFDHGSYPNLEEYRV